MTATRTFKVDMHANDVLSSINIMRSDDNFCDVILKVENKTFPAHRAVLSASSAYFFKMFTLNMREKHEKIVTLNDISPDAMQTVVDFIYTGDVTLTEENAASLLKVASLIQVNDLQRVIEEYLNEILTVQNGLQFRNLGTLYSLENLVTGIDEFILKHFDEFALQKEFFNLDIEDLESLLTSDDLTVEEETKVYEVALKWINRDEETRKEHFSRLFKCIRLQFVPINYVAGVVRKNKFVREFLDCRDLVEDAFFFHINPDMVMAETPRLSYIPEPDAVMVIYQSQAHHMQFDVVQKTWVHKNTKGWRTNLLNNECTVIKKHGKYLFCGGRDGANQASNSVIQFDGSEWKTIAAMNRPRCGCSAVCYKNEVYVFGGEKNWIDPNQRYQHNVRNPRARTDFVESFEVFNNNWKIAGNLNSIIRSYACAEVVQDRMYLIGGFSLNTQEANQGNGPNVFCKEPSISTNVYDFQENTWTNGANLNIARASFGSTVIHSTIYVMGGYGVNGATYSDVEFLETSGNVWTRINTNAPYNLMHASACLVREQIYVKSTSGNCLIRFDPKAQKWFAEQGTLSAGSGTGIIIPSCHS